jgi:hypothetical protein
MAMACVIVDSSSPTAKAATLAAVQGQLLAANGDTFSELGVGERANFLKTVPDARIRILESTTSASFGVEMGGNAFYLFTRQRTDAGFQVYGSFDPLQGQVSTPTPFLSQRQNGASDTAVGSAASLSLMNVGSGPFRFTRQTGTRCGGPETGSDTDGNDAARRVTSFGNSILFSSTDPVPAPVPTNVFRAFRITSGDDTGKYLISFESPSVSGATFTFVALVGGVVNPEPASMAMLGSGLFGLLGYRLRSRRKAVQEAAAV